VSSRCRPNRQTSPIALRPVSAGPAECAAQLMRLAYPDRVPGSRSGVDVFLMRQMVCARVHPQDPLAVLKHGHAVSRSGRPKDARNSSWPCHWKPLAGAGGHPAPLSTLTGLVVVASPGAGSSHARAPP